MCMTNGINIFKALYEACGHRVDVGDLDGKPFIKINNNETYYVEKAHSDDFYLKEGNLERQPDMLLTGRYVVDNYGEVV